MKLKKILPVLFLSVLMSEGMAQTDSSAAQLQSPTPLQNDSTANAATTPAAMDSAIVTDAKPAETDTSAISDAYVAPEGTNETSSPAAPNAKKIARYLKRANELYAQKAYAEAIPYYEKARQGDSDTKLILSNLGDCYRLTNNTNGKLNTYGELIRLGKAEPIHELYYGQALVESGEAEKAQPFFDKYNADTRGQNLSSSLSKNSLYKRNADAYAVNPVNYNSPQNDLCAVKFYDAVVFTSSRSKTPWIKTQQGWTGEGFMNLYATERNDDGEEIPPRLFISDLNSKYNDGPACFSRDYNTIYFSRNNFKKSERATDGSFKLKLLEATLDQNGFSMVKILPFNNNEFNFVHPTVSLDGYTMYFASDMAGGLGGMDIYKSVKDSLGTWGTPVNMGEKINTAGNEMFPFIGTDGLLYFASDGHDGLGGLDIYEARLNPEKQVKKIYNMGEPVNSRYDDFGIYLMEDNKSGFISSNRKAGGMDDDIYELQILREVKRGKDATLAIRDKSTGLPIDSAKIVVNGDTVLTNEKGEYLLSAEDDMEYKLEAIKSDYFTTRDTVTSNTSPGDAFTREIWLEKDPKLFLRGRITDARTNDLLEGVTIKITDIATNSEVDLYTTTAAGDYFKLLNGTRIGDKLTYLIRIQKPGYLQRTVVYTHTIDKPGEINLNEKLNLALGKVEVGMDLAKMIDIKPIYFDLGKSTIRKDAALELDKVVQVMNEYPNMYIELGSHTDCRSSAASNLKLSSQRAKASVNYIVKKGINKMRITSKGYGESKLLNNCACEGKVKSSCPEEEHDKNRRTEFLITQLK